MKFKSIAFKLFCLTPMIAHLLLGGIGCFGEEESSSHSTGFLTGSISPPNPMWMVDEVWHMVKACSDCSSLESKVNQLPDDKFKILADKREGSYNFIHYVVKKELNLFSIGLIKSFLERLEKLDAKKVDEQIDQEVANESVLKVMLNRNCTVSERLFYRVDALALIISLRPAKANDLLVSGSFKAKLFNRILDKTPDHKLADVSDQLNAGNLKSWISWTVAHKLNGRGTFKKLYTRVTAAKKITMFNQLFAAVQSTPFELNALLTDITTTNKWGLRSELDDIVAAQYALPAHSGTFNFKTLYAAFGPAEKERMVQALAKAAARAGTPQIAALIRDIAPHGGDNWGLHTLNAANLKEVIKTVVAEQYATLPKAAGQISFQNLYAAVSNPEKKMMVEALSKAADTGNYRHTNIEDLLLDIEINSGWGQGLGANPADVKTNFKRVVETVVKAYYAAPVINGQMLFQRLYGAASAIAFTQPLKVFMLQALTEASVVAGGPPRVIALINDIAANNNWGTGLGANAVDVAANTKEVLEAITWIEYGRGGLGGIAFSALYSALLAYPAHQKFIRNYLVQIAYGHGLLTGVQQAVDKVAKLLADSFFDEAILKLDNTSPNGAFDPWGSGEATLLYAVLAKAKADAGALTHALVDNGGLAGGLASGIKAEFSGPTASNDWQTYLSTPLNLALPGQATDDFVRVDAGTIAAAHIWLAW